MVKPSWALSSIVLALAVGSCGSDSSSTDDRIGPRDKLDSENLHRIHLEIPPRPFIDAPIAPDRNELHTVSDTSVFSG